MRSTCVVVLLLSVLVGFSLCEPSVIPFETSHSEAPDVWSAGSLYGRTLAQATCTGIMRASGAAYAVRRECNAEAADCHALCGGLANKDAGTKFTCENSIHISNGEGGELPGQLGLKTFRYNSCRVKGCGPNYCCCSQVSDNKFLIRPTCKAIKDAGESRGSGVYLVNPKGVADGAFEVFCDMTTDGGGWTLFASYNRDKGTSLPLEEGKIPTSLETGYSHMLLDRAGFIDEDVTEVRFYCETSAHARRIHFSTKNRQVVLSALADRGTLEADSFRRGPKLLQGSTAHLPKSTTATGASSLFEDSFFDGDGHYWSIRPEDSEFRCDDKANAENNTKHLIFFR